MVNIQFNYSIGRREKQESNVHLFDLCKEILCKSTKQQSKTIKERTHVDKNDHEE